MSESTPKGLRLHVGLFGRRNAGKSSLLNALLGQQVSIVSPEPGTTTDPVEKMVEFRPLGPVLFIDTAGLDDTGPLGEQRKLRTREALARVDMAILVARGDGWSSSESDLLAELDARAIPSVVVLTHRDLCAPAPALLAQLSGRPVLCVDSPGGAGLSELREALVRAAPESAFTAPPLLADLVPRGDLALLVTPIDSAAPKGRLILPQAQALRALLDNGAMGLAVQVEELAPALALLSRPPRLVITDSQAFAAVERLLPKEQLLTSFSILFARVKGDLLAQSRGALAIERLRPGARVLIAEACGHHATDEDIGRVKLPALLSKAAGGPLEFEHVQGGGFPDSEEELARYQLAVHCGACTFNRRAMLSRIAACERAGLPITNYGLAIASALGILRRALEPFPSILGRLS